jgi:uncharacterized delta-60 repeat protein
MNQFIARVRSDGTLDPKFGTGGDTITAAPADINATSILRTRDGRFIVGGYLGCPICPITAATLVRYTRKGLLDPTFAGGGVEILQQQYEGVWALAFDPEGRILAAGASYADPPSNGLVLHRFRPDGTLDPSFGNAGTALTPIDDTYDGALALAVQADGKIVTAGWADDQDQIALVRYKG